LAVINSSEARTYQKELLNAKNEVEISRKNLSVQEELFKTKFSSEKELLLSKKELELTKNELARAEETYKVFSMSKGGDYVVKSPVAGFILEKNIGPELQIRSDMSEYIFSVARLDEVYVALNIYENDIEKVKVGQSVKIQVLSYPDKVFTGKITKIQNIIDPITKTIQARVLMQNKDFELKPEMNCTGYVEFKENGKMIAVPKSAVIFDANKNFVMVYHSNKNIEPREVIVHKETSDKIYLKGGLKAGEKILTKNVLFIYDAVTE
jgi:cobalt-zinc-cadmium efflux system membrane fusion protein